MKILYIGFLFFVGFGSVFSQHTVTIEGQKFFKHIHLNGETLILNGGGLREKYWIDLYVAALYLKSKLSDAQKIIHKDEEMVISIKMISNKVTTDKFIETLNEGFSRVTDGKATREEIKKFSGFFAGDFKSGDKITIEYIPKIGTQVTKNGLVKGSIPGLEFKKALFSIWLGSTPVDEGLKQKVLGK